MNLRILKERSIRPRETEGRRSVKRKLRLLSAPLLPLFLSALLVGAVGIANSQELTKSQLAALFLIISSNYYPEEESSVLGLYQSTIATQLIESKCVACHVENGQAPQQGARLIFLNDGSPGQDEHNVQVISDYVALAGDYGAIILSKIRGGNHGGGQIFPTTSTEYAAMRHFLEQLTGGAPDTTDLPIDQIQLPPGFEISVFARVQGPRSMVLGDQGTLFVGTGGYSDVDPEGRVYAIADADRDGVADSIELVASGLNNPNGVAFYAGDLFVAEIDRILRFPGAEHDLSNPPSPSVIFDDLPSDRWHGWKYIAFGPDGKLYVPVGAPCNVCEPDSPYAAIHRMNPDGSGFEVVAEGVRNTVGFDWHPITGEFWFTDNGRDDLGDDQPPDELNRLFNQGTHFGFPYCFGSKVKDPEFGPESCENYQAPEVELNPHVASLGMSFYDGNQFPESFRNQIFIAEHGSWNSTDLVGYKLSLVTHTGGNDYAYTDFATGWLSQNGDSRWGRPVDVIVNTDGSLLLSDDMAGAIYRIRYVGTGTEGSTDALQLYNETIADPIVGARCIACHVEGGIAPAGGARLVFSGSSTANQNQNNFEAIKSYLNLIGDSGETLLSKVRGVNHGGQTVFASSTSEYQALKVFLENLTGQNNDDADLTGAGLFEGVRLTSTEQTLRRASLILSGRLPTEDEVTLAKSGEEGLQEAILGVMDGEGFHKFILRGANDRLHTDGFLKNLFLEVADLNAKGGMHYPVGAEKYFLPKPFSQEQSDARWEVVRAYNFGVTRAPLELIAHIVENDRPYTEILTADYTMVNPTSGEIYRSNTSFTPEDDFRVFKPGINRGSVAVDENHTSEFVQDSGTKVLTHGPYINYPHAGLLNEPAWLNRYPSTETNRNRARARWTYYHFLNIDIEKSAPRTTDPIALADTNNPTLHNPACTVCHERLDPVAGAYQNYGNEGIFRDSYGGLDSLPETYKHPEWFNENADTSPYQVGDTWYQDMRLPGFSGEVQPSDQSDQSLRWLGEKITADPRFASATVAFWWPAIMGEEILIAPEAASDPNYDQLLAAFDAQQAEIQDLANSFKINGFSLKRLLAEMVLSPWFRASEIATPSDNTRTVELASAGVDRLLTPEELDAKTEAIFGYAWGASYNDWEWDGVYSSLSDRFNIYYGGIDSVGIKDRSTAMTPLMANVAERQAAEFACGNVALDFLNPDKRTRQLFNVVDAATTPSSEAFEEYSVAIGDYTSREIYELQAPLTTGVKSIHISFDNDAYNQETQEDRNLYIDRIEIWRGAQRIQIIEGENFETTAGFSQYINENGDASGGPHSAQIEGSWQSVGWIIWGMGYVSVETNIPTDGDYSIRIYAWGTESGDGIEPKMGVSVDDTSNVETTSGALLVKSQVRQLYSTLLGENLSSDDPEIVAAYDLLLQSWRARQADLNNQWAWDRDTEQCLFPRELSQEEWRQAGHDRSQILYAWIDLLYYFLTHFDYLHE